MVLLLPSCPTSESPINLILDLLGISPARLANRILCSLAMSLMGVYIYLRIVMCDLEYGPIDHLNMGAQIEALYYEVQGHAFIDSLPCKWTVGVINIFTNWYVRYHMQVSFC